MLGYGVLQRVSPIKTSWIFIWWFDFKLELIFCHCPSCLKKLGSLQKWSKSTQSNWLANNDLNVWNSMYVVCNVFVSNVFPGWKLSFSFLNIKLTITSALQIDVNHYYFEIWKNHCIHFSSAFFLQNWNYASITICNILSNTQKLLVKI